MDARLDLSALEAWMQGAILDSGNSAPTADEVVLPSSQLSAQARLAIYQTAYLARLVECMRSEFPMVFRALGQDLFDEFAAGYLALYPSTSYTLTDLGRHFAEHLERTRPQDGAATAWYELLADLAQLEWITGEVFNSRGLEGEPPLDMDGFAPEDWGTLALWLAPCVRLTELRYPVHEYYRDLRSGADAAPPAAARTLLVVSRKEYVVRHHAVSEAQFELLRALERGSLLIDAIAMAAKYFAGDLDQFAATLHGWFTWFAAERLLVVKPE